MLGEECELDEPEVVPATGTDTSLPTRCRSARMRARWFGGGNGNGHILQDAGETELEAELEKYFHGEGVGIRRHRSDGKRSQGEARLANGRR